MLYLYLSNEPTELYLKELALQSAELLKDVPVSKFLSSSLSGGYCRCLAQSLSFLRIRQDEKSKLNVPNAINNSGPIFAPTCLFRRKL